MGVGDESIMGCKAGGVRQRGKRRGHIIASPVTKAQHLPDARMTGVQLRGLCQKWQRGSLRPGLPRLQAKGHGRVRITRINYGGKALA
jgi:hypothetical protein